MENLNEVIEKLTEFLKSEVKTETIIGQQFQLGEFTCVPVINVGLGLGTGGGEGKGNSKKPPVSCIKLLAAAVLLWTAHP